MDSEINNTSSGISFVTTLFNKSLILFLFLLTYCQFNGLNNEHFVVKSYSSSTIEK